MNVDHAYSVLYRDNLEIRISVGEYKEKQYLDLRLYFQPEASREMRPTKKGITIPVEHMADIQLGLTEMVNFLSNQSPSKACDMSLRDQQS